MRSLILSQWRDQTGMFAIIQTAGKDAYYCLVLLWTFSITVHMCRVWKQAQSQSVQHLSWWLLSRVYRKVSGTIWICSFCQCSSSSAHCSVCRGSWPLRSDPSRTSAVSSNTRTSVLPENDQRCSESGPAAAVFTDWPYGYYHIITRR